MIWAWSRKISCSMISAADRRGRVGPILLLLALLSGLAACDRPREPITFTGGTMGTVWTVRLSALPAGLSGSELRAGIETRLEQVNAEMSTYRADSLISAFNTAEPGLVFALPDGFASVLGEALYWAEQTAGAFDPTAGPLVNLWGFGPPAGADQAPDEQSISDALSRVGWQRLDFDPMAARLTQTGGVYLDLSAIAKGWAVDLLSEYLIEQGASGFMVDIGGDLRTHGRRPDGRPWRVAIERPRPGERAVHTILEVGSVALATSGDYRNFFTAGERRFSHLIDPRNGYPVAHETVSVTVAAARCLTADALATALSILPIDEGWALAVDRDLAVLWILAEGDALIERTTPAFIRLTESGAL